MRILEFLFQVLVHRERDCLTRRNAHDSRCDTLIKRVESFLSMEPISSDSVPVPGSLPKRKDKEKIARTGDNRLTHLNISLAMADILVQALSPGIPGIFCRRVLIVSIGALLSGPIAPETSPMIVVCHEGIGVSAYCGW